MFSLFSLGLFPALKVLGTAGLGATPPLAWVVLSSPAWYSLWKMKMNFESVALDCYSSEGGADRFVLYS